MHPEKEVSCVKGKESVLTFLSKRREGKNIQEWADRVGIDGRKKAGFRRKKKKRTASCSKSTSALGVLQ